MRITLASMLMNMLASGHSPRADGMRHMADNAIREIEIEFDGKVSFREGTDRRHHKHSDQRHLTRSLPGRRHFRRAPAHLSGRTGSRQSR
jgi:hypothetical protein